MIDDISKEKCAGCGACIEACPVDAIGFCIDEEGFNYPKVKREKCINCGICEKTCPWLNLKYTERGRTAEISFYAAQLKDKKQLGEVSSGGASWALALYVLSIGGVVYGAIQKNIDNVIHSRCDNFEDLKAIRRSKYLQSDLRDSFKNVKKDLNDRKLVLFTGTACQVAGLLAFLRKDYGNLITADVVCHGVPSPRIWKSYKYECEANESAKMVDIVYRDKSKGWLCNQYSISFSNGTVIKEDSSDNPFHRGYLFGLYSRPACGNCQFNLLPRVSDFTFADYWMYEGKQFKETLQQGVSLVAVNTQKAQAIIQKIGEIIEFEPTTRELALKSCRQMNNAPLVSGDREEFWKLYESKGFSAAWKRYIKEKKERTLVSYVRRVINRLRRGI